MKTTSNRHQITEISCTVTADLQIYSWTRALLSASNPHPTFITSKQHKRMMLEWVSRHNKYARPFQSCPSQYILVSQAHLWLGPRRASHSVSCGGHTKPSAWVTWCYQGVNKSLPWAGVSFFLFFQKIFGPSQTAYKFEHTLQSPTDVNNNTRPHPNIRIPSLYNICIANLKACWPFPSIVHWGSCGINGYLQVSDLCGIEFHLNPRQRNKQSFQPFPVSDPVEWRDWDFKASNSNTSLCKRTLDNRLHAKNGIAACLGTSFMNTFRKTLTPGSTHTNVQC